MNQCEELLKLLMEAVQQEGQKKEEPCANGGIPVGVSNRHVHVSQADLDRLFGPGYASLRERSKRYASWVRYAGKHR